MSYNQNFKDFFDLKGISNRELSRLIGYSETMTGRYLNGQKMPIDFILSIIKVFPDIDLNLIFKNQLSDNLNEPTAIYGSKTALIEHIQKDLEVLKNLVTE